MEEIKEYHSKTRGFFIKAKKLLEKKTKFQTLGVYDHDFYGKILRLDNYFQLSEFDEFLYHEPLVQFPLFSHENPKKILLIGGGDGGALEEVLKHKNVEEVIHIELDEEVIEVSKKHLGSVHKNAFEDEKVTTLIQDGLVYLENTKETFDVIILDLTDPIGESKKLYTQEFYELTKSKLNSKGILSLHVDQLLTYPKLFSRIYKTLESVFENIAIHSNFVPIYGTLISFALCSKDVDFKKVNVEDRFKEREVLDLKYFSPEVFSAALVVPRYLKDLTREEVEVITLEKPLEDL